MSPAGSNDKARIKIDRLHTAAGWHVCDYGSHDISRPAAIREFPLKRTHDHADYLLYVQGKTGVRPQILFARSAFGVLAR